MNAHALQPKRVLSGARRRTTTAALLISAALLCAVPFPATAAPAIAWGDKVQWLPFDTALARAKTEGRAVGVVLYADWCPKCRALAPQFIDGPVRDASDKVLWVLQNHDEQPAWLNERFADLGNYVPRIFFLAPDGSLARDITSGHPRYPYFYLANKPEILVASIERAAALGAVVAAPPTPPPAPEPVAPAPLAAAPAPASSSGRPGWLGDLPLLGGLVAVAFAAVWAMGRGKDGDA